MIIEVDRSISFVEISALKRIKIPTFSESTRPEIRYSDLATRRYDLLDRATASQSGQNRIAEAMARPLRTALDYQSIARRVFEIDPMSVNFPADYLAPNGNRIRVETQTVSTTVTVSDMVLEDQRFSALDTVRERIQHSIQNAEDARAIGLLNNAAEAQASQDIGPARDLVSALVRLRTDRYPPANLIINPSQFSRLVRDNSSGFQYTGPSGPDSASIGSVYGATVYSSTLVPESTAFLLSTPAYVGRMAIRNELEIVIARDEIQRGTAITGFENIGMAILNLRAIVPIHVEAN